MERRSISKGLQWTSIDNEIENMKRNLGFTLVELMVALAVLVILIAIALPSFTNMIQSNRSAALANSIVTALNVARSEAVKRNALVNVNSGGDWTNGWVVQLNTGAVTLQTWNAPDVGAVITQVGGNATIQFNGSGRMTQPAVAATINSSYPHCSGQQARQIRIGITGRVGVTQVACP